MYHVYFFVFFFRHSYCRVCVLCLLWWKGAEIFVNWRLNTGTLARLLRRLHTALLFCVFCLFSSYRLLLLLLLSFLHHLLCSLDLFRFDVVQTVFFLRRVFEVTTTTAGSAGTARDRDSVSEMHDGQSAMGSDILGCWLPSWLWIWAKGQENVLFWPTQNIFFLVFCFLLL